MLNYRHVSGLALMLVAGLAAGCMNKSEVAAADLNKAKTETKAAAKDFAYAQRAELLSQLNKELVDTQAEVDRLSANVDKSRSATNVEIKAKLQTLRDKWAVAKNRLQESEGATESTWDELRAGARRSFTDLKDTVDETRKWLSEKIEP